MVATVDGVSVSVGLEVEQIAVRIEITKPKNLTLARPGKDAQFEANAYDANGFLVEGKDITWSLSNPLVATITSPGGYLLAVGHGTTKVRASMDGVTVEVELTVN